MSDFDVKQYWEKRLASNYNLQGVGYISYGKHYNSWMYRVRKKVFHMISDKVKIDNKSVLDIGPGTGFYLNLWKEHGASFLAGADITETVVKNLSDTNLCDAIYLQDISKELEPEIAQRHFDVISAFDVLFHIVDDAGYAKAISNVHNMLSEGGLFIFSDNFLHNNKSINVHQVSRSLEEIKDLLEQTGFDIVERFPMFVIMNSPMDASPFILLLWRIMMAPVKFCNVLGYLVGMSLYPLELVLIKGCKESFTTEIMICRKRALAQ